jgi:hypothetical protein
MSTPSVDEVLDEKQDQSKVTRLNNVRHDVGPPGSMQTNTTPHHLTYSTRMVAPPCQNGNP